MAPDAMSSDAAAPARLEYEEVKEANFLEELLARRVRDLAWVVTFACCAISIALAVYHLYVAAFGTPEGRSFRSVHLTVMLVLAVLMNPLFRSSHRDPLVVPGDRRNGLRVAGFAIDLVLVALALFVQVWTLWDIEDFHLRYGEKETPDLIVGGILIALVLEATRRAVGIAMVCVTGCKPPLS